MPEYGYDTEDEIDLVELTQTFWSERILIAKIVAGFLILGLIIALFSTKEYSAQATLMPEVQSGQSKAGSLLQKYGGALGIGGASMGSAEQGTIPPQLYPNIVQSLPYQLKLMQTPVRFSEYDTTATMHQFYTDIYDPSLLGYLGAYTVGLPGKVLGLFSGEEQNEQPAISAANRDSVISLSKEQMETIKKIKQRVTITVDQQTGVLTLSGTFSDPQASAEITQKGIALLRKEVKDHRTKKAKQNLGFVKEQLKGAKQRFGQAQSKLAEFRDSHRNLTTAKAQSRQQELQSQYDLTFSLYNSLSQQLQQKKLELQQNTPVLSVLQPVSVPLNDNTSGFFVLIVTGILGGILALGWVLVQSWWRSTQFDIK